MQMFIGRQQELEELKTIWMKAKAGQPQVVNYIADTGVGKTRLVQAFYEWLSTDPEQGDGVQAKGYWPDQLGVGRQRVVNPPLDRFEPFDLKNRRVPWLWWGMYWTDAPNETKMAFGDARPFLDVHLRVLEVFARGNWAVIKEIGSQGGDQAKDAAIDFVKDLAVEFGQEALVDFAKSLAPGFFSVASLAKVLVKNKKERDEIRLGQSVQRRRQIDKLRDDTLARMEKFFKGGASVPMVLFLDDIHFATDVAEDEDSLLFLDSVLRKAAFKQWPLLVIATHWKGPWQAHDQMQLGEAKPWRVIEDAIKGDAGLSEKIQFHDVFLEGMSGLDFRRVALDFLPGLSAQNLEEIFSKVDNVRWLVELLRALQDGRENFEGNDRSNPLSDLGIRRLDALLSQQGYLGVIRQRLQGDEMSDVRAVLGAIAWHANGLDFVAELAHSFESKLVELKLLSNTTKANGDHLLNVLLLAQDPAALIESDEPDAKRFEIVRFPERGYLFAAKELFDEGWAQELTPLIALRVLDWMRSEGGNLPYWKKETNRKTQKVFLAIAIDVLGRVNNDLSAEQLKILRAKEDAWREMVEDGEISIARFEEKLRVERLRLKAETNLGRVEDVGKFQVLAMAELVGLLWEDGDSNAWAIAFAMADRAEVPDVWHGFTVPVNTALNSIWRSRVELWPLLRRWAEEEILGESVPPKRAFARKYLATGRLAELDHQRGDLYVAREGYVNSLVLLEQFVSEFGEVAEFVQDKIRIIQRLADIDRETGQCEAAHQGYLRTLSLLEDFQSKFFVTADSLRDIGVVLERIADLDREMSNFKAARSGYLEVLSLNDRLIAEFGETPSCLRDKAVALDHIADMDLQNDQYEVARQGYLNSYEIRSKLLSEYGGTSERFFDMSISLERLAVIDQTTGQFVAARQGCLETLAIRERLLAEFGETPEFLRSKAVVLERLGNLDRECRQNYRAEGSYIESLAIWQRLLAEFGNNPDRMEGTMRLLEYLADIDKEAGKTDAALQTYAQILEIYEKVFDAYGETSKRLCGKAKVLETLASMNRLGINVEIAHQLYLDSLITLERSISEFGESSRALQIKASVLMNLSTLQLQGCQIDSARQSALESISVQDRILNIFGETSDGLQKKAAAILVLAGLDQQLGQTNEARKGFFGGLAIYQKLLSEFGESYECLKGKSGALIGLAGLNLQAGQTDVARQGYLDSLETQAIWFAKFGESPEYLLMKTTALAFLAYIDCESGYSDVVHRRVFECRDNLQRLTASSEVRPEIEFLDGLLEEVEAELRKLDT